MKQSVLKKADDGSSDDGSQEATLHVQVKSWRGGATVATAGAVLHVQLFSRCAVSLFRLF